MNERTTLPAVPDLGARLPGLSVAAGWLTLDEVREHWRGLAGSVVAGLLWPWLVAKLGGLVGLGLVDGLVLVLAGELVALGSLARWYVVQRQAVAVERRRLQRLAVEDRLVERGYSTLFAAYKRAVVGTYDPPNKEPILVNFAEYKGELRAVSGHVDELVAGFREELAALRAARPVVTVCPVVDGVPACAPELEPPSILPLLDAPAVDYAGSLAEQFVDCLIQGHSYGLRAFVGGVEPVCSEQEYRALVDQLVGVGVLIKDVERRTCLPAPALVALRGQWALAGDDLARRMALEDSAHAWVLGRLVPVC